MVSILLDKLDKYFPGYSGALLCGSQSRTKEINPSKDVDIIVFMDNITLPSSVHLTDIYEFDFLLLPLNNIDHFLLNEYFDSKGIALNMINTGRIIKDTPEGFLSSVQQQSITLFDKKKEEAHREIKPIVKDIIKIKRLFSKPLDKLETFIILNYFSSKMLQLHYLKTFNITVQTIKHSVRNLISADQLFTEDLYTLVQDIESGKENIIRLSSYIDNYLSKLHIGQIEVNECRRVILDIYYENITLNHFLPEILPVLLENEQFAARYLYFHLSPRIYHRIYKNKISLVMDPAGSNENELSGLLYEILTNSSIKNLYISVIPTHYINKQISISNLPLLSERLQKEISAIIVSNVHKKKLYRQEDIVIYSVFLISYTGAKLGLKLNDLVVLNLFLMKKWIFNYSDQRNLAKENHLDNILNHKIHVFGKFYKENEGQITSSAHTGISYAASMPEEMFPSKKALLEIDAIINSEELGQAGIKQYPNTYRILMNMFPEDKLKSITSYSVLIETVIFNINPENDQVSLVLYLFNSAILQLQKH